MASHLEQKKLPQNRFYPRPWDPQYYTLKALAEAIERVVREDLSQRSPESVLDFGCGDSPYRSLFESHLNAQYVGADLQNAEVLFEPGKPVPLKTSSFDAVASFQVLEHVRDLDWYLGEARRLLKPEGTLVLSTHGVWLYHPHPTDYRRWTADGLREDVEQRGFRIVRQVPLVGPLAWTTQFRLLGYSHLFQKWGAWGAVLNRTLSLAMNARMTLEDAVTPASISEKNAAVYLLVAEPA